MRIPLSPYGWPQTLVFPAVTAAAMIAVAALVPAAAAMPIEIALAVFLAVTLSFFRDPERPCPCDKTLMLAPADGRITDITNIEYHEGLGSPAVRIGIFLNIFNVHINRSPCDAVVEKITYRPGRCINAADPLSGRVNESNDVLLRRTAGSGGRILVRQISGAIARRIVCAVREGDELSGGQRFGMIKFGSRTELYAPLRPEIQVNASVGDKVRAGMTVLLRYEPAAPEGR